MKKREVLYLRVQSGFNNATVSRGVGYLHHEAFSVAGQKSEQGHTALLTDTQTI